MIRKTPPPKPADAKPAPKPADSLLLPDDTPYIEGHHPDGTPYRVMKRADPTPPAPKPPVTIADLRKRIKRMQQDWIDCAPGDIALRFFVPQQVADWWNDARLIPGVAPPPPMSAPFPRPSDDPQQGLAAADLLLRWLEGLEAPPKANEPAVAEAVKGKGVAPRNAWFLAQYEAHGTDTYHKPAKIHAKWEAMKATERAEICPDSPNKIAKDTVWSSIKRELAKRDGPKPAKPKRTRVKKA